MYSYSEVYLNRADRQLEAGQYAAALAAYLAAQDVYPASRLCREGIETTSAALMGALRASEVTPPE